MPDYDLSGLSHRSFEQLIQAIAAKVIGNRIVIFGDGPDGGREATFEGAISYPDKENGWKGYGVVQAKFCQKPKGSDKDGKWALDQLELELKKFTDSERNLRKPEYYIFATNVVLTPVHEKGTKDKANAIFQKYKKVLSLKGYDIWDYDKIRIFLDTHEDIRRSYAAWITSSDVLSEVIEWLKLKQPNFEKIMENFLQKELLADQYVNLEQAGHATDEGTLLARVFIDLPVCDEHKITPPEEDEQEELQQGFINNVLNVSTERLDPKSLSLRDDRQRQKSISEKHEPGKFVIIGGPGQGKTTISQFICQLFRAAILKRRPEFTLHTGVKKTLSDIETQCINENIHLLSIPRFPLRIVLNEFASVLASQKPVHVHINSLLSYVADRIRKRTDYDISVDDLRQWLSSYPWIIILDGLDEVPASSNRDDVLDAIHNFWIDARGCNADILAIATSRPQGYNQDFSPEFYNHKWLTPLSPERAMHYAQRLAEVRYGASQDRKEKIILRLQRASKNEATAQLMQSPLQVTIMTTLVDRMGQPPQERWNLFKEYYTIIYQREMERDIPASTILRDYKADIDVIHYRVGLLLQIESDVSGCTEARLTSDRFADLVHARLTEEGHEGETLLNLKQKIIETATHRLVFLVGLEAKEVGFEIRSLQEFMAAEALMEGSDEDVRKRLREIAFLINWRNVFLFASGKGYPLKAGQL